MDLGEEDDESKCKVPVDGNGTPEVRPSLVMPRLGKA